MGDHAKLKIFPVGKRVICLAWLLSSGSRQIFDTPLLVARTFEVGTTGLSFPDISFRTGSIDAVAGSAGLKVNIAPHILANFNLRFHIAGGGLTDRVTPLIGIEFGS